MHRESPTLLPVSLFQKQNGKESYIVNCCPSRLGCKCFAKPCLHAGSQGIQLVFLISNPVHSWLFLQGVPFHVGGAQEGWGQSHECSAGWGTCLPSLPNTQLHAGIPFLCCLGGTFDSGGLWLCAWGIAKEGNPLGPRHPPIHPSTLSPLGISWEVGIGSASVNFHTLPALLWGGCRTSHSCKAPGQYSLLDTSGQNHCNL